MIVACPSCLTRFRVPDEALGADGRNVRCSSCKHVWHQMFEAEEPAGIKPIVESDPGLELASHPESDAADTPSPEADQEKSPVAEETADSAAVEATAQAPGAGHPARVSSGPQLPPDKDGTVFASPRKEARKAGARWGLAIGWILFVALIGGLTTGSIVYRQRIIDYLPPDAKQQAAGVYDWLGLPFELPGYGLKIEVARSVRESRDNVPILVIEGNITNTSRKARPLPRLRAALQGGDGRELQHWFFDLGEDRLLSGQATSFRTSVDNPDNTAKNLSIVFVRKE